MNKKTISEFVVQKSDLITPKNVAEDYNVPEHTQAVWRSTNRYGWRDMSIKLGRKIAYRRNDIEAWLESRRGLTRAA